MHFICRGRSDSEVASILEGALADATAAVAKGEVVVRLPPAEGLRAGQDGGLGGLVLVTELPVLAPARLVLALGAVVGAVLLVVLHLEHVVEALGSGGVSLLFLGCLRNFVGFLEVVNVGVLLVQKVLQFLDPGVSSILGLTSLFLKQRKRTELAI